jgi:hypothetical protein
MKAIVAILLAFVCVSAQAAEYALESRQITFGPKHHFFGYIGHVQNTPWNQSGRYLVALQTESQDHLPGPDDPAEIVLLDATRDYAARVVDRTRAWNPQQGTMLYWNPAAPETQFFFNDRDPATGKVFCVLFDISLGNGRRIREFRFDDTPIGNSGVSQPGGWFAAINYGRLARLRAVTGYRSAFDWTQGDNRPASDGVFRVDVASGKKQLLVSYQQLADHLRARRPDIDSVGLFINHTLVNRSGDQIFFFVRGNYDIAGVRLNEPLLINSDGTGLRDLGQYLGGHPEWDQGRRMMGSLNGRQVVYDTDLRQVVETIANVDVIPNPEGDIALSPDGQWLVNGYRTGHANQYVLVHRPDGAWVRSGPYDVTGWTSGDLRCDAAPCWRRDNRAIVFPAIASDPARTRQMFLLQIKP